MNEQVSSRRFAIEIVLFLTYMMFAVSWMAVAPLAPALMSWFHVTKAQFALLSTVVTISKVFAPVAAGALTLRFGLKNTILLGSLFIAFAFAGPFCTSFPAFLASRALFGIGGAVLVTLTPGMIMQWFPRNEVPLINGINGVAANTGFALAMSLTVPLSQTALGWRGTLAAYGSLNIALFFAWVLVGRDGRDAAPAAGAAISEAAPVTYLDVWRKKETWLVAFAAAGPIALYVTFALWLPTYYREQFHFDMARAARYCSIILYAGIPSAVVSAALTQRLGVRRPFLIVGGIVAGTAAFGTFLSPAPAVIAVSAVLLGIGLFIPTAALMTLVMELKGSTPRHVTLVVGTMFSVCYVITSIAPNAVGWLSDKTGSFVPGFAALTLFSWVVVLSGVLLPETGPAAGTAAFSGR